MGFRKAHVEAISLAGLCTQSKVDKFLQRTRAPTHTSGKARRCAWWASLASLSERRLEQVEKKILCKVG